MLWPAPLTNRAGIGYNLHSERGSNSVVECNLAKVEVAGSNPVSRSKVLRLDNPTVIEMRVKADVRIMVLTFLGFPYLDSRVREAYRDYFSSPLRFPGLDSSFSASGENPPRYGLVCLPSVHAFASRLT
jgi:hypothetical protein